MRFSHRKYPWENIRFPVRVCGMAHKLLPTTNTKTKSSKKDVVLVCNDISTTCLDNQTLYCTVESEKNTRRTRDFDKYTQSVTRHTRSDKTFIIYF